MQSEFVDVFKSADSLIVGAHVLKLEQTVRVDSDDRLASLEDVDSERSRLHCDSEATETQLHHRV